jgi:hypothetical protein
MAKELYHRNKVHLTNKVQAGSTVAKEPRSASSGFSLKPESRISAAAMAAERLNPKVIGKEEVRVDPGQGYGKE